MEQLSKEGSKNFPKIEFNPNGDLKIHGRCIVEDSVKFFNPIFKWINSKAFDKVKVDFQLDYINTSGLIQIYSVLNLIQENYNFENVNINWYYEEDDEDIYEVGKTMEAQVHLQFNFVEFTNAN